MNIGSKIINESLTAEDLLPLESTIVEGISKLLVERFGMEIDEIGEPINDRDVDFFDDLNDIVCEAVEDEFVDFL
jgi:hypothetical protein